MLLLLADLSVLIEPAPKRQVTISGSVMFKPAGPIGGAIRHENGNLLWGEPMVKQLMALAMPSQKMG